jgi:hypothetical protein
MLHCSNESDDISRSPVQLVPALTAEISYAESANKKQSKTPLQEAFETLAWCFSFATVAALNTE